MDQPRLLGVEFLAHLECALPGHVFRAERARDAVLVVMAAAVGMLFTERRRHDGIGQKEVRLSECLTGFLGDVVARVARERELGPRFRVLDDQPVTDHRRVGDGNQCELETAGLERRERRLRVNRHLVEVVVALVDARSDALTGDGVGFGGGVDRKPVDESVGVAQTVEVVEVDVGDDGLVGKRGVGGEELLAEIG